MVENESHCLRFVYLFFNTISALESYPAHGPSIHSLISLPVDFSLSLECICSYTNLKFTIVRVLLFYTNIPASFRYLSETARRYMFNNRFKRQNFVQLKNDNAKN